ncbi:GPAT2 acyltransferase, partial [Bucorvus abyssinicus]|nr:GPAT2 acyltransferase [Bucorvus abyssinicus]
VQDVACSSGADGGSRHGWKEKVLQLLAEIQAPLSRPLLRLCHWALLKLLARLFLNVQLHRGQLEMVRRAQRMVGSSAGCPAAPRRPPGTLSPAWSLSFQLDAPLVFLSTHQSLLDGPLLAFILFSQGLGAPRVAVGGRPCSPLLRALLSRLGGVFLPSGMEQRPGKRDQGLPGAVLAMYIEEVLRSQQPLLIFLEEPPSSRHLSAAARQWLAPVCWAVRDGAIPDILLVPVGIAYDVVP